jgi:hypothetical protein
MGRHCRNVEPGTPKGHALVRGPSAWRADYQQAEQTPPGEEPACTCVVAVPAVALPARATRVTRVTRALRMGISFSMRASGDITHRGSGAGPSVEPATGRNLP